MMDCLLMSPAMARARPVASRAREVSMVSPVSRCHCGEELLLRTGALGTRDNWFHCQPAYARNAATARTVSPCHSAPRTAAEPHTTLSTWPGLEPGVGVWR